MNLAAALHALRLDQLAVEVVGVLEDADVPCVILKGQSTSEWLYPEGGRLSSDVDVLVPRSALARALEVLGKIGFSEDNPGWSRYEKVPHAFCVSRANSPKVDVHHSLHTVDSEGDAVWAALSPHITSMTIGSSVLPVLDEVGRALVITLHALMDAEVATNAARDLDRLVLLLPREAWSEVAAVALELRCLDSVCAALRMAHHDVGLPSTAGAPARPIIVLRGSHAPNASVVIANAMRFRGRHRAAALLRALAPTPAFMRYHFPETAEDSRALAHQYVRRIGVVVVRGVPSYVAWLRASGKNN